MLDGQGVVSLKRYAGGFTYRDPDGNGSTSETLDFFGHAAGRVKYYAGARGADRVAYEYAFKDHLGNTRLLVDPDGAGIIQASAYYPYGLRIGGLHQGLVDATAPSTNEELYNGKELTDAHGLNWYHYGARFYDVEIARWTTMDPADQFHSPYTYVGGDPVNLIDPDGRQATDPPTYTSDRYSEGVTVTAQDESVDYIVEEMSWMSWVFGTQLSYPLSDWQLIDSQWYRIRSADATGVYTASLANMPGGPGSAASSARVARTLSGLGTLADRLRSFRIGNVFRAPDGAMTRVIGRNPSFIKYRSPRDNLSVSSVSRGMIEVNTQLSGGWGGAREFFRQLTGRSVSGTDGCPIFCTTKRTNFG